MCLLTGSCFCVQHRCTNTLLAVLGLPCAYDCCQHAALTLPLLLLLLFAAVLPLHTASSEQPGRSLRQQQHVPPAKKHAPLLPSLLSPS